jgi:hypothetical protein
MSAVSELTTGRSSAVTLRVDHIEENLPEATDIVYCTDIGGTQLRVAIPEASATDLQLETGQWYRFADVTRARSPEAKLLHPLEDTAIERTDAPEEQIDQPTAADENPWLVQLGTEKAVIAITVQPRPTDGARNISIADPETFEIGAVCFTHCNGTGDTTVYHREESPTEDEHLLLEHVVEDLSEAEETVLITCRNSHKPLELLYQRLRLASEGDIITSGAEQSLGTCFHAAAGRVANRAGTNTLTELAQQFGIETSPVQISDYDTGLSPTDWRENWAIETTPLSDTSDTRMIDRDYSALLKRYLGAEDESIDTAQLAECLKDYASADLDLLRGLVTEGAVSQLGCRRFGEHRPDYINSV